MRRMSVMRSSGLLGVSTQTMRGRRWRDFVVGVVRGEVGEDELEVLLRRERAQQPLRAAVAVVRRDDRRRPA